jgi:hexosaminidase
MTDSALPIIPAPIHLVPRDGHFMLPGAVAIEGAPECEPAYEALCHHLASGLGIRSLSADQGSIRLHLNPSRIGYRLSVTPEGIEIEGRTPECVFHGVQSLRQLLPADSFRRVALRTAPVAVPCVEVEDAPRFGWRGIHLDVGRHFMPKEFLLKLVDLCALYKLNKFHLHLTEDQGWRMEIRKYPKLTEVGAWRTSTMLGHYNDQKWDDRPHGGFYTQDDLRELVRYAADRYVTVVPEIEMPGHAQAAIAAYPELGNTGQQLSVGITWGVSDHVFNPEESTVRFLQDVLDEVLEIFPSEFIHIGGDECPKTEWKASTRAQELIRERGLKDEDELQSWFIRQMDGYLAARGRRLIGWDEILEGGLAPGATVMSWRGEEGGIAAAKAGHDVVMTPGSHTYLDHYQAEDTSKEPVAIGGFTSVEKAYGYEPVPPALTAEEAKHVLGSQAQLWTEYMPNAKHVEYMAFPRLCALAEVFWTQPERKDYSQFLARLAKHREILRVMDVDVHP